MADLIDAPGRWDSKQLLAGARAGDADCLGWLLEIYRNYLHLLASAQLNERPLHQFFSRAANRRS